DPGDVVRLELVSADQIDRGDRSYVRDRGSAAHLYDRVVRAPDRRAGHAAAVGVELDDLATRPDFAAVADDDVRKRLADADCPLRVESELPERTLLHEVGEERLGGNLVGVDREDRRREVAEQAVNCLVRGRAADPLLERQLLLGIFALPGASEV